MHLKPERARFQHEYGGFSSVNDADQLSLDPSGAVDQASLLGRGLGQLENSIDIFDAAVILISHVVGHRSTLRQRRPRNLKLASGRLDAVREPVIQTKRMHANYPNEKARASSDIAPCRDFTILGKIRTAQSR